MWSSGPVALIVENWPVWAEPRLLHYESGRHVKSLMLAEFVSVHEYPNSMDLRGKLPKDVCDPVDASSPTKKQHVF